MSNDENWKSHIGTIISCAGAACWGFSGGHYPGVQMETGLIHTSLAFAFGVANVVAIGTTVHLIVQLRKLDRTKAALAKYQFEQQAGAAST